MSISESDISLIDRFLDGTLEVNLHRELEERRKDSLFESVLQEQKLLHEVIHEKGHTKIKSELQALEIDIKSESREIPFFSRYRNWIMAAAAALLLAIVGTTNWPSHNTDDLFSVYYTDYPNLIDPLTKGESGQLSPYQLYEQGAYEDAILELNQLSKTQAQEWYLGLSYIGIRNYQNADESLDAILSDPSHTYYTAAQWYKSLILLKKNELENCKEILTSISLTSDHPYSTKARLLLEAL